ncbi:bacteriocin [Staphylococcus haemolyticus]|nr:bacteriocin [Staphylococcus haemolyticus]MBC3106342.1 bacteriocin [Staphylococcus haemolyticus]MCT1689142.1 bacteriocin [Staphylococcus haemolyticus]MCT1757619.1 bacteriocin [Staphylococcus haemolyticus]MDO0967427.1 bacteriocin [Staphylococcus haemolyticus]
MKSLNITELKAINGGEVNDARRNGEKIGKLLREVREAKNPARDLTSLKG